jgi:two-component system, OmpR family, heavy metal sensor histidine kinase CusS
VKRERSIRFRLTLWYALALSAGLGLFAGAVWFSMRQTLTSEVDRDLAERSVSFEAFVRAEAAEFPASQLDEEMEEYCRALPASSYLELRTADGSTFFRYGRVRRHDMRSLRRPISLLGKLYELEIGFSLQPIRHTLRLLGILLVGLIPVIVLIACAGGLWLSRRALKPVDEITSVARSIGINNLSLRIPERGTGDELERLTDVWNTMLARLESAVATLSQFAADASHELRTPLSIIRTSAEIALRRPRSEDSYRETLEEIVTETGKMTQLVEDLLSVSRSDASLAGTPSTEVDVVSVIREACDELRSLAESRDISFRVDADSPVMISGNEPALRRLFLALLDNALKYSKPGGRVMVGVISRENRLEVTVEDFGTGISEEDLPHIFERFYRADKARTGSGYGLGLSLAKAIANAHQARIDVTTALGKGSKFCVTFPPERTRLRSRTDYVSARTPPLPSAR